MLELVHALIEKRSGVLPGYLFYPCTYCNLPISPDVCLSSTLKNYANFSPCMTPLPSSLCLLPLSVYRACQQGSLELLEEVSWLLQV